MENQDKKYKVTAPIGNIVPPKDMLTEKELRIYAYSLIRDTEEHAVWSDKIQNDPIESVIEWLNFTEHKVEILP